VSNLDPNTIANKLERMTDRLDRLTRYRQYTLEQYLADSDTQIIGERLLELVIQAALDMNKSLLKRVVGKRIKSSSDLFIEMGLSDFISTELANQLASLGSFRNVLAHEYDDLTPQNVFAKIIEALDYFPDYIESIQNYLDSLEVDNAEEI